MSAAATSGTSYAATASVPYTGGNGAEYPAGTAVASTGVTGLTATLSAVTLATGNGTANVAITGTPASSGTATFAITLGGQSCSLPLPVIVSKASISSLTCIAAPTSGTSGMPYTGTVKMAYMGGTYSTSGATLKASPTTSGSSTLNTITF